MRPRRTGPLSWLALTARRELIAAWFTGPDDLRARPAAASRLLQVQTRLAPDTFPGALANLELVDRAASQRLPWPATGGLVGNRRRRQPVMIGHGLRADTFPVERLLEPRFAATEPSGLRSH